MFFFVPINNLLNNTKLFINAHGLYNLYKRCIVLGYCFNCYSLLVTIYNNSALEIRYELFFHISTDIPNGIIVAMMLIDITKTKWLLQ